MNLGEIGGGMEEAAADYAKTRMSKPIAAFIEVVTILNSVCGSFCSLGGYTIRRFGANPLPFVSSTFRFAVDIQRVKTSKKDLPILPLVLFLRGNGGDLLVIGKC